MGSLFSSLFDPSPEELNEVKQIADFLNSYILFHSKQKKKTPNLFGIELVKIPEGTFWQGSPDKEEGRSNEKPRHQVQVPSFWIGKYPITQAQWRAVAVLPKVNIDLSPDPSYFKGDDLPVEQVSWYEAVEFCDRLTQHSNRPYRLPSEAEWEYACRGGTETPFHFGETITPDLVNYNGNHPYGSASEGTYRNKTTPVGSFPPNRYGVYDLHGNVWEWCQDHWHYTYEGAPTSGSAWLSFDEEKARVRRGGSWNNPARNCRSAYRSYFDPRGSNYYVGFRVVMAA